jgi:hypothetical protein
MKYKTQAAQAAAQIREILKKEFPTTKFSVKSENYSMGDSIRVYWTDGVAERKVEKLIAHYEYGQFNGMEDIYEYTNRREDIPQTKYLFCNREVSDAVYLSKLEELRGEWDFLANVKPEDISEINREIFDKTTFSTARQFIYSQFKGFQEIDILPEKEEPKKEIIEAENLGCQLVNYSEKAVALFGNTKPIKDKLKEIGGRFNPFLNNNGEKMAGWIFPKSKLSELQTILN